MPLQAEESIQFTAATVDDSNMWCGHCQLDVPGVIAPDAGDVGAVCPRCQQPLWTKDAFAEIDNLTAGPPLPDFPFDLEAPLDMPPPRASAEIPAEPDDDWDDEFTTLDPWLDELIAKSSSRQKSLEATSALMSGPTPQPAASPRETPPSREAAVPARPSRSGWFAWAVISLGLMLFICGAVLLGWAFFADKAALWRLGMPLTLIGQAALIVGLVLQLDSLWTLHRQTSQSLRKLGGELKQLEHATTLLTSSHSTSAQSFYVHLAERASPHLLLADLKGQLDLLAVRLAQRPEDGHD